MGCKSVERVSSETEEGDCVFHGVNKLSLFLFSFFADNIFFETIFSIKMYICIFNCFSLKNNPLEVVIS